MTIKSYSELANLTTFEDRFTYLKLDNIVGHITFGFGRHVNQQFYMSREWHDIRQHVIVRDDGCDLGIPGYEIHIQPLIHHMNPIDVDDIVQKEEYILDPEFLITTIHQTHNAIHYGVENLSPRVVTERTPSDTTLW